MFPTFAVTYVLAQVVETNPVAHDHRIFKDFTLFQLGNTEHV